MLFISERVIAGDVIKDVNLVTRIATLSSGFQIVLDPGMWGPFSNEPGRLWLAQMLVASRWLAAEADEVAELLLCIDATDGSLRDHLGRYRRDEDAAWAEIDDT